MVDLAHLLAMSLVALVIIAVPGPSVLFVISRGVSLGRKRRWPPWSVTSWDCCFK